MPGDKTAAHRVARLALLIADGMGHDIQQCDPGACNCRRVALQLWGTYEIRTRPARRWHKMTPFRRELLKAMLRDKTKTLSEVAERFGLSKYYVARLASQWGIHRRPEGKRKPKKMENPPT